MSEPAPLPFEALSPAETAQAVDRAARTIDLDDPTLSIAYGAQAMLDISSFADALLERVRAKNAGPVGEVLSNLMVTLKRVDPASLDGSQQSFLEKLPLVGSLFNSMERTAARFKTLSGQVESIAGTLEEAMVDLLKDVETLEQLYEHNKQAYQELSVCISVGRSRLEAARATELPRLQEKAEKSSDGMAGQAVRDFAEKLNRFERRLHDLQLSRTITLQTAPQIRLLQSNDQVLAEKIQTSILSTIPIWKSQMVLALSLHGQKQATALQRQVADTTNEMLRRNAAMLESSTVETAREAERSIVDAATLRDVHGKLLATIEETLRIAQEGRARRQSVEAELAGMEQDLKTRLADLAVRKSAQIVEQASAPAATPDAPPKP